MSTREKKDVGNNQDTKEYLEQHLKKSLLRFLTCGSVDDGKSTLLGRLLYETKAIFSDQFSQLQQDSKKFGTQGDSIDYALLLDGLSAEQEQGITIDVAYRFFSTEKRKFIVADTPGHEQYTRNMATGASTADAAVILIDARKGILSQTKRHSYICHLFGIEHVIVLINKMDLVKYDELRFQEIVSNYELFASKIGIENPSYVPISGIHGDNVVSVSKNMNWYRGPSLLKLLEDIELADQTSSSQPFRMPVQLVNRPNSDFRGVSGKPASGYISKNDEIAVFPSGKKTKIKEIITPSGTSEQSSPNQSITLTFMDEIDCSRGHVIASANSPLEISDQLETTIIWMHENAMVPGRSYHLKIGCLELQASCAQPKYKINIETSEHTAAKNLELNEIGVVIITTIHAIPFTSYQESRDLGGFILIDKSSNITVAAGLINFALRRSQNIHWQNTDVTKLKRATSLNQKPSVLWMTGLSGSGKSTIANEVELQLEGMGFHTYLLDGDNIRHGLNKDLGFTEADRIENIRRIGEVSKLMTDAGLIVITAFISPFQSERNMVRKLLDVGEFIEIFIDTPLQIAEKRDVKGLYAKARAGELKNFTGIDSPYERPAKPEITIDTRKLSVDEAADTIVKYYLSSIIK
ncbi:sulfate adenylyltransferase subunit CysN [Paracoccaceae bacterium]|nr:sulfate adenylyltransferase subunit CysN [Paracoccaceae bacterium]MDC3205284.1 sulfate adenylyltransferase subunit CysN [Paracoccaceae bacterium]